MYTVIEEGDSITRDESRIMLVSDILIIEPPLNGTGIGLNTNNSADAPETDDPIAVGCGIDGISVCPLTSIIERANNVYRRIQVMPRLPIMHKVAIWGDLQARISAHPMFIIILLTVSAFDP